MSRAALHVVDLGRMAYAAALDVQRRTHADVLEHNAADTLLLVEHDPVITVSNRPGVRQNLLASAERLAQLGIDVQPTDRGGDITYHGPGQLVAYPILRLAPLGLNIARYMRLLEQIVIDTVATFGVAARTEPGATGVWVGGDARSAGKLCAMGVRVRRIVTMHGLALNVTTDLTHFDTIVPCGLAGCSVTSMRKILGDTCPEMSEVKTALVNHFNAALQPITPSPLRGEGRGEG